MTKLLSFAGISFAAVFAVALLLVPADASAGAFEDRLAGRILLDVERDGEAWYVYPETASRYYLGRPEDAFRLMRLLNIGITDANLEKIPVSGTNTTGDVALRERLSGRILLQVEQNGEAWYVDPSDNKRVFLGYPADAFDIMTQRSLGITTENLKKLQAVPPPDFKIAFLGDQGVNANARAVLQMLVDENADAVVHLGDLGYEANGPVAWNTMVSEYFEDSFPYLVSIGNHDVAGWDVYESIIRNKQDTVPGLRCSGETAVTQTCEYHGMTFALSGVGTQGTGHEAHLEEALSGSEARWDVCAWHKNQRLMQVGGKTDEVGWDAYDTCRKHGAIVATGHEHSYSRTHLMSNFENQTVSSTSSTLDLFPGSAFAFVSGLAGKGIRVEQDDLGSNPWWASVSTASNDADYGALLCSFTAGGNESMASCSFKDIQGRTADTFTLVSHLP